MNIFNNFNNLLILLFSILFCYILFCWIAKSCFGYKIIEGIDNTSDNKSDNKSDDKNNKPKVVTKDSVEKKDKEKDEPPSKQDTEKNLNESSTKVSNVNDDRQKSGTSTPPSDKLVQAKFS